MRRGEIYRAKDKVAERGLKPGFYVVVSRNFVADNEHISTVVCAPVYSEILGLRSEVVLGREDGMSHDSALRCDFLMLMFKRKLTRFVGTLTAEKIEQLNQALHYALELRD